MDSRAYWITRDTILSDAVLPDQATLALVGLPLTLDPAGLSDALRQTYPHLANYSVYHLPPTALSRVPELLKGGLTVSARSAGGQVLDTTGVQIAGVLDDLYQCDGPLGITFDGKTPTLRVWAPTARGVKLHLYSVPDVDDQKIFSMTCDPHTGVWSVVGNPAWYGKYYRYEVEVYLQSSRKVVPSLVTDPYSVSLSTNSRYSQIVDLSDPAFQPAGWREIRMPPLAAPEDIVLYELHVRDFSFSDETVPPALRGTYRAFTFPDSHGMRHLRALAEAGLTHIHLLPVFDFATVDDNRATWKSADTTMLRSFPPDSEWQARAVEAIQNTDGYNWGYDPYHFTVPEGSYATDPEGPARILEFREMVQALNNLGLCVVMDVVYNHTTAYGQDEKSVLDRIVPGYYHRRNARGEVETSTCCPNTATEHAMMRKLMVDSIITWAKAYKVNGFRFDLMGHHMKEDIESVREALDSLTMARDGVSGRKIYIYGEAWDFGEVGANSRGTNASQQNIAGIGVGSFNDRFRDGVRGGAPFDHPQLQGFVTGLYCDPNDYNQGEWWEQQQKLLSTTDLVRLGLAGNLKNYPLVNAQGETVNGNQIEYRGGPAGYTLDPGECINYVSAHDNETLFDAVQLKASSRAPLIARIRMHALALSLVLLGQGIPFIHGGDDLLRSKSLDRNSFNSGDWFNAIDFSGQTSNWGVGLPPGENTSRWNILKPLLANPALKPGSTEIQWMAEYFRELLRIRKSSPLFRLRTEQQVRERLSFLNTGPEQIPGLIVMCLVNPLSDSATIRKADQGVPIELVDSAKTRPTKLTVPPELVDSAKTRPTKLAGLSSFRESASLTQEIDQALTTNHIIVFFNAVAGQITFTEASLVDKDISLHPIQAASVDDQVRAAHYDREAGVFSVPGRTTAIFLVDDRKTRPVRLHT
jgi:pullulanase